MGNSKTKPEVEKTSNNLGLINFEENNLGTMGPFEIAIVILLFLGVLVLCRYCHQRCKKSGIRAVQEGMSRATQESGGHVQSHYNQHCDGGTDDYV